MRPGADYMLSSLRFFLPAILTMVLGTAADQSSNEKPAPSQKQPVNAAVIQERYKARMEKLPNSEPPKNDKTVPSSKDASPFKLDADPMMPDWPPPAPANFDSATLQKYY